MSSLPCHQLIFDLFLREVGGGLGTEADGEGVEHLLFDLPDELRNRQSLSSTRRSHEENRLTGTNEHL